MTKRFRTKQAKNQKYFHVTQKVHFVLAEISTLYVLILEIVFSFLKPALSKTTFRQKIKPNSLKSVFLLVPLLKVML